MISVGSVRTGEELGRAFPGTPVVVSGAREDHGVVAHVDSTPRLVVATPGAEPVAESGYRAVLLMDAGVLSTRPELGAAVEALRRWTNAVVLADPQARVLLLGGADPVAAQALVRWDHEGMVRRELADRAELHLPPAWRAARLDGGMRALQGVVEEATRLGFETLGPSEVPARGPGGEGGGTHNDGEVRGRALVRVPVGRGRELSLFARHSARQRSVAREESLRVELDPTVLW